MFILTAFNLLIMALLIAYVFYRLLKTKDVFTLVSFTLQLSAFTIVLLSLISGVETSRQVELFYIIFGIVIPCCFLAFDYRSMIKTVKSKGSFEGLISVDRKNKVKTDNSVEIMSVSTFDQAVADTVSELGLLKEDIIKGIRKKLIQAETSYNSNNYEHAYDIYQSLTGMISTSPNLYFNFGNICFKKGLLNEALSHFRKVLELNDHLINNIKKSSSAEVIKNIQFREYLIYYNIAVTYLNIGKLDFALDNFKKSLEINPSFDSAKEGVARVYSQNGQKLEAVKYYEDILKNDSKNYEINLMLGKIAADLNDFSKAQESFEKCIKIDSQRVDAYGELGSLLLGQRKYQEAIKVFNGYIKIKGDHYLGHYNLAVCFYHINDPDRAICEYETALKLNPKSYNSAFNMGLVYEETGEYERAIECYKNAILINIEFIDAYNNLGILFSKQHRQFEALATYANGIKVSPNNFRLYYNMGVVLFDLRRYDDAADAFKKALEINPQDIDAYYLLGSALTELKRYEEAIKTYSKVLGDNADKGELYYNIAAVNALMKNQDAVLANLKNAISIEPKIREQVCLNRVFDYLLGNEEFVELIS